MRKSFTRRGLAAFGLVAVLAATVTGCSDDSDDSSSDSTTTAATTSASEKTTAAAATADAATTKEITDAFVTFFNGTTPPADRAALVENGDVFLPTLEGMTANPQAMATTATVEGVTLTDPANAAVKWTLLMGGNPVLPDQSGEALEQAGKWKVSANTFCSLMAIQGGGAPVPGC
ncbi:MAG: hypothetical protein WAW17_26700 [Rhodococcus sp. (in: high G+C Gram-positive bacteria)]|uniref:hypothetical protein n=1 Tax=Rhodococcus sp. TaxID=1831 RepID=UPI003BB007C7